VGVVTRRTKLRRKPILTRFECKIMCAIYDYYTEHCAPREKNAPKWMLDQAACDVIDGWLVPSEWAGLVKKRILQRVRLEREDWRCLAGERVRHFAVLTDYGLYLMRQWRARVALARAGGA
jgi:hypothetical protein